MSKDSTKIVVVNEAGEREAVFDLEDIRAARPGFVTRTLLWLAPRWGVARLARELGYPPYPSSRAAEQAHRLLKQTERVDVLPAGDFGGGGRGFQIVLDGTLSLYFFQDGDHFAYDGYELGEYERGDVTLFDDADRRSWEEWERWGEE